MKPKGINPLELHVEKIVIGCAIVIVALLGARQLFTQPNAIEIQGESKALAPSELDQYIARKAEQLETAMATSETIDIPQIETLSEWFVDEHSRTQADKLKNPVSLTRPTTYKIGGSEIVETGAQQYADFIPPSPKNMRIHVRRYSIEPAEIVMYPKLADIVGDHPPFDLPVVHVLGNVDGTKIKKMLETIQEDKRTIPSVWWQDDMSILDVSLERQQLLADGTWSKTELVPHVPGDAEDLRTRINDLRFNEMDDFMGYIGQLGEEVYQVPFYRLYDGSEWSIKLLKADEPLTDEEEMLLNLFKKSQRKRMDLERRIERYDLSQERKNNNKKNSDSRGSDTGGGFGEGGATGKGRDTGSSRDTQDKKSAREIMVEALDTAIQEEDFARERVRTAMPDYVFDDEKPVESKNSQDDKGRDRSSEEYGTGFGEGTGFDEGGGGSVKGRSTPRSTPRSRSTGAKGSGGINSEVASLLENEKLEVWTHDINVEPGNTYRYRLIVDYFNPFYGRSSRLDTAQKSLADKVITPSVATEWSDPVRVTPPQQFYAVDGNTGNLIADRKATFEIYLFSGGQHRMTSLTVKPGDPIGEQKTIMKEDFGTDETKDSASDSKYAAVDEPVNETVEIDFYTGAILLDVLPTDTDQTGFGQGVQVVICLDDGSIVTLNPEAQREDEQRKRLREAVAKSTKS